MRSRRHIVTAAVAAIAVRDEIVAARTIAPNSDGDDARPGTPEHVHAVGRIGGSADTGDRPNVGEKASGQRLRLLHPARAVGRCRTGGRAGSPAS